MNFVVLTYLTQMFSVLFIQLLLTGPTVLRKLNASVTVELVGMLYLTFAFKDKNTNEFFALQSFSGLIDFSLFMLSVIRGYIRPNERTLTSTKSILLRFTCTRAQPVPDAVIVKLFGRGTLSRCNNKLL